MIDTNDTQILDQLHAIQTLLDAVINQMAEDCAEDVTDGPEKEEGGSLLARAGR